ncbi:MAG: crotonase/enoyl-CoA hydratase family protein [Thermoleophilia bacterium]|nr:crotonase/enoyl-CoA hydratase family protein [Thermoleophilia bacterium]
MAGQRNGAVGIGNDSEGRPDPVLYERRGAAAIVTINRPERRNAVDGGTADALHEAYERFVADDGALAMVLTGAGDQAFCAGADLKNAVSLFPRLESAGGPLGFTRLTAPKPTIAAISGWALAGGFELALWCDLRICAEGTTFGFAERRWGVPLIDGGTQRLPRIVGAGRALDLVLTGRMVELDEAMAIGLVTQRVPAGEQLNTALELAERLAEFPRETMLADRAALLAGLGKPLADGLAIEAANGMATVHVAAAGANRFAGGEGRGGAGV